MEKIEIGKCLSELPVGDAGKIVGISGENGVLTTPLEVANAGGCGTLNLGSLDNGKWYRIAIGNVGSSPSSAILNIGKSYSINPPTSQVLYVFADGYSGNQKVNSLVNAGLSVGKMRILYKGTTTERTILDIFISSMQYNIFILSYSCNIGFTFQRAVEVPATPDAGYSVKEFTL